ncbi:MAG: DUF1800 domain-containing protein [Xanthomonadales bacterium]|nr:DUF1800 domain-containing protein [Xanthomonadales bacterium]
MKSIETFIAVNRFGLGPAPGEADRAARDPRGWVRNQTRLPAVPLQSTTSLRDAATIGASFHTARMSGGEGLMKSIRAAYRSDFMTALSARTEHQLTTDRPFGERMVRFWFNHFTVSTSKRFIGPMIPAYEREAIRPHVFGRFSDLLRAATRHPVMLTYLDNQLSMGDGSRAGRFRTRRQGVDTTINENHAREILELHTLGVNGGYTQKDVMELARALTGWTHGGIRLGPDRRSVHGEFEFNAGFHEPGTRTVLGKRYPDGGPEQGEAILDDLARHPETANFLATKLVRHFVADDPPAADVAALAAIYRDTDGDLGAVSRGLVDLPSVWAEPLPKVKDHEELVISALRVTGSTQARARDLAVPLQELGQAPFSAPSPAGWGDRADDWLGPEALLRRVEWLRQLAATLPSSLVPARFLEDVLGPVTGEPLRTWVERAPSPDAALALVLASPAFQRR